MIPPKTPSLVTSLVKGAALWALPTLLFSALALTFIYRTTIYRSFDDPLRNAVTALIASAEVEQDGTLNLSREPLDPQYQRALSGRYWLIGARAENSLELKPLAASRSLYGSSIRLPAQSYTQMLANAGTEVLAQTYGPDENEPLRVIARQVLLPGMDTPVIVLAAADRRPASRSIRQFAITAIGLLSLVTFGIMTALYTQVRVGLRPLFDLRDRVADVREGRTSEVGGEYPPEIAPLAQELNDLISHNKSVVERARTHVGNLAHALKTPIAVLQNEANAAGKTPSDIVSRQTGIMASQVDHHLRRARAAARGQAIGVTTEIDPIIDGLIRTLPRIYRDKDFVIERHGLSGQGFRGAQRDFEEMIGNLMDNAAKWTTDKIVLTISQDVQDNRMVLRVADNGPGLDPEDYAEALKRGARLDEATPGSGLGLAIVTELAEAYKGHLELGRAEIGGLEASLILPRRRET